MEITFDICQAPPEKTSMDALLSEYYDLMISRIEAMGGSVPPGKKALVEFWDEIDLFLPPTGQLVLAKSEDGSLVGCGSLKSLDSNRGELKRLFVRPQARGLGLGRKLVEIRVDAAREMGLTSLLVDTLRNNLEMRGLYQKMGFNEIEGYAESASVKLHPNLEKILCYYSIDL